MRNRNAVAEFMETSGKVTRNMISQEGSDFQSNVAGVNEGAVERQRAPQPRVDIRTKPSAEKAAGLTCLS